MESIAPTSYVLQWLKRYWFMAALLAIFFITLLDSSAILSALGNWVKNNHGTDILVVAIFFLSGFALSPEQLKNGLMDIKGMLLALLIIFVAAPLIAVLFSLIPMDTGIVIGLFLVAVMPSTLSSGVVMTAAAGGSAAHALVTTIVSNSLSIFTIPYSLSILLALIGQSAAITIDKVSIMSKIGVLVILPLVVGMTLRHFSSSLYARIEKKLTIVNQCLILFIVWVAMSQTRVMILNSGMTVILVVVSAFLYHALLLIVGWFLAMASGRGKGKRESLLFIGGQKTLPLSIILQMSLFPQYGIVLVVCVLHHIVHLMMDGYLVERLK